MSSAVNPQQPQAAAPFNANGVTVVAFCGDISRRSVIAAARLCQNLLACSGGWAVGQRCIHGSRSAEARSAEIARIGLQGKQDAAHYLLPCWASPEQLDAAGVYRITLHAGDTPPEGARWPLRADADPNAITAALDALIERIDADVFHTAAHATGINV